MNKYIIPSLRNACRVMNLLSNQRAGMTLAAITRSLDIPRTTALRILSTLHAEGMVTLIGKDYGLGHALIQLGTRALENVDIRTVAIPVLRALSHETMETAHLAVPSRDRVLLVEVCDSPHPVRVASRPGTFVDIHCSATGKVFLAYRVEDLAEFLAETPLPSRTENTCTSIDRLANECEQIRKQGFAVDEEEYNQGVRCLAAPIRDSFGEVVAAIGITGGTSTFPKRRIRPIAKSTIEAADRVSAMLGAQRTTMSAPESGGQR